MNSVQETNDFLKSLVGEHVKNPLLQVNSNVIRDKHVTLSDGSRITLRPKSKSSKLREAKMVESLTLLSIDKDCMNMPALYEKLRIAQKTREELQKFEENRKGLEKVANALNAVNANGKRKVNNLWTEKYRPKKFIDLIGNEKVNASILRWLNEWNYAVKVGKLVGNNQYNKDAVYNDPLKRPRKKVLLIHGPPGIGKTTIAQCVCRQLGYEMQEINSSDERSGQSVCDRIRNVLKMQSLSGKDVCLLLDEIDGASGSENGFVKNLVAMLNKDIKATDEWNSFGKLKYNKKDDFIKRPIIAMCNDIGSHCLEQLKPYCEIISFRKSSKKSIKKRLKMILEKENINNVKESLLDDLILSLDFDIRNCINFLQFNSQSLTGKVKDTEIIWFHIIREIFNLDNINGRGGKKSKSEVFNELMTKLNNSNSDSSKINMGCFTLMLQINDQYDSNNDLRKLDDLSDWLYFEDLIHTKKMMMDKDEIAGYHSVLALKYFNDFSNFNEGINSYDHKKGLNFKSGEKFEKRKRIVELINKLMNKFELNLTRNTLITSEISMLNAIIIPKKLTVKEFEKDKAKIDRILNILDKHEIKIEISSIKSNGNMRVRGGYITFNKFNPDIIEGLIDSNCEYQENHERSGDDGGEEENNNLNELKAIPYINVINEVYKLNQRMRIEIQAKKRQRLDDDEDDNTKILSTTITNKNRPLSTVDFFKQQYSSFHSQLHNKQDEVDDKIKETGDNTRSGVMNDNANRIWVKYHEGFSNAVRKEITWQSIFERRN
ncbi:hypothetical protein CANINC_001249 [Pichia inconspicua]|uniref:AAA+ ATPase domain-containing protein n=1 Tax=Pichia inconspicua TaxID=52247 RepID=A0A4T0X4G0_9ASCO|nr:hypothetical protein CANINC_001249 [[Candida] inconspicua]